MFKENTYEKTLFIFGVALVSVFCVLACKNAVGNPSYTVVGVETVQGFIDNPDVFLLIHNLQILNRVLY